MIREKRPRTTVTRGPGIRSAGKLRGNTQYHSSPCSRELLEGQEHSQKIARSGLVSQLIS